MLISINNFLADIEFAITLVGWIMCDMFYLAVWAGQTCKTDLTVCMRRNISVVSFLIVGVSHAIHGAGSLRT